MTNDVLVASEVHVDPAGWLVRAYLPGQFVRVNCSGAIYHGVINNIQGEQDEIVDVKVDDNRVIRQSVRIQL